MNKYVLRRAAGALAAFAVFLLTGCGTPGGPRSDIPLSDSAIAHAASVAPLKASAARLMLDNDEAFAAKLQAVRNASRTLDMVYYIWGDDYSSSALTLAVTDAARRGVKVRLLLDYTSNYRHLDLYTLMEQEGGGNIQVRFYGRPTRNVVMDAAYLTLGCPGGLVDGRPGPGCPAGKVAAVDKLFADELIDGQPASARNVSNRNTGGSGLFLSGLYAKRPDVMALAVTQGQGLDPAALAGSGGETTPAQREQLKKLAKAWWLSRTGNLFERVQGSMTLLIAGQLYGEQVGPLRDLFAGLLPVERPADDSHLKDWDYLTEFTHHKLLLADRRHLVMGGRNVEDAYHMHPNPMAQKPGGKSYVFMDTDVAAELTEGGDGVTAAFERLWGFAPLVARLDEVRQHAPNELVANAEAFDEARAACNTAAEKGSEACLERQFLLRAKPLDARLADARKQLARNAQAFGTRYAADTKGAGRVPLPVDAGATLAYLENLPFAPDREGVRHYGAEVDAELASGKQIHHVWTRGLAPVCARATAAEPQRIVLHNAYFFPPANLTAALAELVDGRYDCSNVTVTVLTNSTGSTDLAPVNLLARHAVKAFAEFAVGHRAPARAARFQYFEYLPSTSGPSLSLHSKVSVLGDEMIVGSANADVRSFMLDSNNALLLRNAPTLVRHYVAFVDRLLDKADRVREVTREFAEKPRQAMVTEDLAELDRLLARYRVAGRLQPEQLQTLRQRFVDLINASYTLTSQALDPAASAEQRRAAQQKFNELFKAI